MRRETMEGLFRLVKNTKKNILCEIRVIYDIYFWSGKWRERINRKGKRLIRI